MAWSKQPFFQSFFGVSRNSSRYRFGRLLTPIVMMIITATSATTRISDKPNAATHEATEDQ
jgi:hypothetical protein